MGRPSNQHLAPIGFKSGLLTVIGYSNKSNGSNKLIACAQLKCVCGNIVLRTFSSILRSDIRRTLSCGCQRGKTSKRTLTLTFDQFNTKIPPGIIGDYNSYLLRRDNGGKSKFTNIMYGDFEAFPSNVFNGKSNHPLVSKARRKLSGIKQRHSLDYIKAHIPDGVQIYENTYISSNRKARFNHPDVGDWIGQVHRVLKGHLGGKSGRALNSKRTCINKYGVPYAAQNPEIARKMAKSIATSIEYHWKTGEELICQSSWEDRVIKYLNINRINFLWQPKTFSLPDGSTYRPDLYLEDSDMWIEIKGYSRQRFKNKWVQFICIQPNSEIWNLAKLKEMKILEK